jgi:predicted DsbA family dithiol-disulfide isomerase
MPVPIRVYSDFVCPFCFLAEFPLKEASAGKDVAIEWMPFELRPYPTPTLRPEGDYLQNAWRNSVYPIARRMGVDIQLPTVSPQPYTRLAFEGLEFAKDKGKGDEYNDRVMRAFFQESRDIGDPDVLTQLAAEAGLDAQEFRHAISTREYGPRVKGLLRHAYEEIGIQGVPLFVIGDRVLTGLQSKETLAEAIEQSMNAKKS